MKIGFIGLGKMGANMVEKLLLQNHQILAFDINKNLLSEIKIKGAEAVASIDDIIKKLPSPKMVWLMLPAGEATNLTIEHLEKQLQPNDIIINGANSYYKETQKLAKQLLARGIYLLDVGTSGGIWGLKKGYCLMIGGEKKAFEAATPLFHSLAPENGFRHVGESGAGHFVKMIHNGIEYGMMQSYAEGFELLNNKKEFDFDLKAIANLWNKNSIVKSWLLELAEIALEKDASLSTIKDYVEDSGEGRWTLLEGIEQNTPVPVIAQALFQRFSSRQDESFSNKITAALRNEFGGHAIKKK